jgi:hypothetical protein
VPLGYFVYYRVDPAKIGVAGERVTQLLDALAGWCGVRGRLLKKRDEPTLWMEVYEPVTDAARFEISLQRELERLDFDSVLLSGSRRTVECFES